MTHATDRRWWILLAALAAGAALVSLAAHAYLGTFSRYIADDFCTASNLRRLGFFASQANWYQTWSGRYSYTFVVTLAQAVGPALTPWLPSLALLAWIGAALYAVRQVLGAKLPWLVGLSLAALLAFATLEGSPTVYQSLYWQTGMVTYALPLILSVTYGAWLWQAARGQRPKSLMVAGAISLASAFLLGGFSETYVVLQTAALTVLLLTLPFSVARPGRSRAAVLVGAGLVGSLLAGAAIASAPGTQVRRGLMPAPPGLATWIEATLRDGYLFVARTVKGDPGAILLAIALPCLFVLLWRLLRSDEMQGRESKARYSLLPLLLLPVVTPVLMLSTIAPYEFAISSYPDARVLITTMFVLVAGLMAWGASLGAQLARWPSMRTEVGRRGVVVLSAIVAVALLVLSLRSAATVLGDVGASRAYAQSWETRDRNLRQAAVENADLVAAASLRHMGGLAEIGRNPEEWINRCVAGTYGVGSVVAK